MLGDIPGFVCGLKSAKGWFIEGARPARGPMFHSESIAAVCLSCCQAPLGDVSSIRPDKARYSHEKI